MTVFYPKTDNLRKPPCTQTMGPTTMDTTKTVPTTTVSTTTADPLSSCNFHCPEIPCWETYIGQTFYRVSIVGFLVGFAKIAGAEYFWKLAVSKNWFCGLLWDKSWDEMQLVLNVLELIYLQTTVWIGLFYSPVLPILFSVYLFIFFYLKKSSILKNYKAPETVFKFSSASIYFYIILGLGLLLAWACFVIGINVGRASEFCGPFLNYAQRDYAKQNQGLIVDGVFVDYPYLPVAGSESIFSMRMGDLEKSLVALFFGSTFFVPVVAMIGVSCCLLYFLVEGRELEKSGEFLSGLENELHKK